MSAPAIEMIPFSKEAELCVLGAVIADNEALDVAREIISDTDFHNEANRRIFACDGARRGPW
jgi:replicative DNA helicase